MTREWKPGDVAVVDGLRVLRVTGRRVRWVDADGDERPLLGEASLHPLVVIDPDDDANLSRLWRLLPDNLVSIDQLQAALREFANPTPPKPEEPTGLGAVVEDAEGKAWVRAGRTLPHGSAADWRCTEGMDVGCWSAYSAIAAVRVLSEGITP